MNIVTIPGRIRSVLLRLTVPLFYESIGPGSLFMGHQRLPRPLSHIRLGAHCMIGEGVFFQTGRASRIEVGDEVSLNTGCHVVAAKGICIGSGTAVGEYVSIRDQDHRFTPSTGVRNQGFDSAPIKIGENCWIGRGVHIGPGTLIGSGCIVAANSVVRGRFGPSLLIAGAPATVRRRIAPDGSRLPLGK